MKSNIDLFNEKRSEIESLIIDELLLIKEKHCKNDRFNFDWPTLIETILNILASLMVIGTSVYSTWKNEKDKAVNDLKKENKAIKMSAEEAEEIIKKVFVLLNIPYPPTNKTEGE